MMNNNFLPASLLLCAVLASPASLATPSLLATGVTHTFVLKNDGTLLAWGNTSVDESGQATAQPTPQIITDAQGQALTGIKSIAGNYYYFLALNKDGTLSS